MKSKKKEKVTRDQVADRLDDLARELRQDGRLTVPGDSGTTAVAVPDQVTLKQEYETTDAKVELEIELAWSRSVDQEDRDASTMSTGSGQDQDGGRDGQDTPGNVPSGV